MYTLLVDVSWNVNGALVHVDADVVEMLIFFQRKLACVKSLRHRITYLLRTFTQLSTSLSSCLLKWKRFESV